MKGWTALAALLLVAGCELEDEPGAVMVAPEVAPAPKALTPVMFKASGEEPFWSLTLGPDKIVLARPEAENLVAPYEAPEIADNGEALTFRTPALEAVLRVTDCIGASGEPQPYEARVVLLGGEPIELVGCASPQ